MKFRFDAGDRVRVLNGKSIDDYTGSWGSGMKKYVGHIATVLRQVAVYSRPAYRLQFDGCEDWHDWDERGLVCVCEPRFKEGDRVKVLNTNCGQNSADIDSVLTISSVERIGQRILYNVEENNYTWFDSQFAPVTDETIVIHRDGNAVIARDCTLNLMAKAKCSPDDKFDFYTGAVIALERLREMERKQRPIEVGDTVRVVDTGHCLAAYSGWSGFSNLPTDIVARYAYGEGLRYLTGVKEPNTQYSVLAVAEDMALIEASYPKYYGKCYLVGLAGLERV